jgi:hypothetical protein
MAGASGTSSEHACPIPSQRADNLRNRAHPSAPTAIRSRIVGPAVSASRSMRASAAITAESARTGLTKRTTATADQATQVRRLLMRDTHAQFTPSHTETLSMKKPLPPGSSDRNRGATTCPTQVRLRSRHRSARSPIHGGGLAVQVWIGALIGVARFGLPHPYSPAPTRRSLTPANSRDRINREQCDSGAEGKRRHN